MRLTETRIKLLKLLAVEPSFYVAELTHVIAPRDNREWSPQSAARWGGGYVIPLEKEGLIKVNRHVRCGVGLASITKLGREVLSEHEQNES